ncbi:hypothetical protein [Nonomuraea wenchangensis]
MDETPEHLEICAFCGEVMELWACPFHPLLAKCPTCACTGCEEEGN